MISGQSRTADHWPESKKEILLTPTLLIFLGHPGDKDGLTSSSFFLKSFRPDQTGRLTLVRPWKGLLGLSMRR